MMNDTLIEQQLTAVEKMIRELQHQLANSPPAANGIEQITGSFKDEPAFEEVLDKDGGLGREN